MRYQHTTTKQTFREKDYRMWHNEALQNKHVAGRVIRSEFVHRSVQHAGKAKI